MGRPRIGTNISFGLSLPDEDIEFLERRRARGIKFAETLRAALQHYRDCPFSEDSR